MSDKFIITPNGPLKGDVHISGAKNAVLPVLAATLLTGQQCLVQNVPNLSDVEAMCGLLESLGAGTRWDAVAGNLTVCAEGLDKHEAAYEWVGKLRASFLIIGPMLARLGRAKVPLPGGCAIGSRPVDLHLKGLAALGAEIEHAHGFISASASKLTGARIYLDFPSVGATESIMMAASLAQGQTILENCAVEPEIVDLANFLNAAGADIRGAGTDTVKINGTQTLRGVTHSVIPDRIEAGTFMVAAALTRGDIRLTNVMADHLKPVTAKLKEVNVSVAETEDGLRVFHDPCAEVIAADIKTMPYPGFPTDMQALFMSLMATAAGTSIITETVFENRFMQVGELKRMGAEIKIESRSAVIEGVAQLAGAQVNASDLRAGAALMLAALNAHGKTELHGAAHVDRGYCALDTRLNALGACVQRIS
ncbi:MAG: UDP-N-acetylglucosamine 1-carboxyvinyltransferase [Defluviitaleaceae bacterium]|nr:UDP-N-acetylglucosamine 1-carboxyvinyltransferase [Defluviitaleaceae bacterium]MCL2240703.1 UDP-N-acetylglucosamine 1-carboxyvinyltransferase [Defluviitaleaceae bacterium]